MQELKSKSVIVTGASRGIGAAAAREFAGHGAGVLLAARTLAETEAVAADIRSNGGTAHAVACDVSRRTDVERAVDTCKEVFGTVDILVNNAGLIEPIARLGDSDPDEWDRAVDVNYKGVYYGLRAVIPLMEAQGTGVIVNISSGAATSPYEGWSHYCSTKAAVLSLTQCVHKEYGDRGIQIVGLSPGTVATHMQVAIKASGVNPVSQLDPSVHIQPKNVARAIAWLCTKEAVGYAGSDLSLRSEEGRRRAGLVN